MRLPPAEIGRRIVEAITRHASRSPMDHPVGSVKASHFGLAVPPPVYTNATRPAASSVDEGGMIYNSDDNAPNFSDGTNWRDAAGNIT